MFSHWVFSGVDAFDVCSEYPNLPISTLCARALGTRCACAQCTAAEEWLTVEDPCVHVRTHAEREREGGVRERGRERERERERGRGMESATDRQTDRP